MTTTRNEPAQLATWLVEPVKDDVARTVTRLRCQPTIDYIALMPDVHMAGDVCIGAVIGSRDCVMPAAVGSDIGCGMAAVAIDAAADLLSKEAAAARLLAELYAHVPCNKHPVRKPLAAPLRSLPLSAPSLTRQAERDGAVQLGTLGRGNHFLEFQSGDSEQRLWLLVHSGSRAIGQAISKWHQRPDNARDNGGRGRGLVALPANEPSGQAFLRDVAWARTYARENRLAMLAAVDRILKDHFDVDVDWETMIHNDHNHVHREHHGHGPLWVHRKGAQSAALGEPGVVPGSMGTATFHVMGRGLARSLASCSHGAGRRLSRQQARRTGTAAGLRRQLQGVWFDHRRATRLIEEGPTAYNDIEAVMRAQRPLTRIVRRLTPLLSYKGS